MPRFGAGTIPPVIRWVRQQRTRRGERRPYPGHDHASAVRASLPNTASRSVQRRTEVRTALPPARHLVVNVRIIPNPHMPLPACHPGPDTAGSVGRCRACGTRALRSRQASRGARGRRWSAAAHWQCRLLTESGIARLVRTPTIRRSLLWRREVVRSAFSISPIRFVRTRRGPRAAQGERIAKIVMLTGDNAATARRIGADLGGDAVEADLLPDGKVEAIKRLKAGGRIGRFSRISSWASASCTSSVSPRRCSG